MRQSIAFTVLVVGWSLFGVGESSSGGEINVMIELKQGTIETPPIDLGDGRFYYAFKNIPFAEPPIGPLRFKNPVPAGPWAGVRHGSKKTTPCPQFDKPGGPTVLGSEDCLYLDVYTPKPTGSDLPVMVWIHGGVFVSGSARAYLPDHLMTKDVVVVVIQYRLGTLGFLSTEDSVMSGNYAFKDQVMALRWVQENIHSFGGDPKSVTIFGEGAGGISVHALMISPMAKGLFQRAIAQSGTVLVPGMIAKKQREYAAALGQMLECPGVDPSNLDSQALYDCLQDLPEYKMVEIVNTFEYFKSRPQGMGPSIDGEFFPEHPMKMLKEGNYNRVDFMTGICRDEGGFYVRSILSNIITLQNLIAYGPLLLNLGLEDLSNVYLAKRMFYHYFGSLQITEEKADDAAKMFGDIFFNIPMDFAAKMHARDAAYGKKTYLYEAHHVGEFSLFANPNATFGKNSLFRVSHGDEIQYLFTSLSLGQISQPDNLFMSEIMVALWTNFAATGNPTPNLSLGFKWLPLSGPDLKFLILQPSPYMRGYTRSEEMEFVLNLPTDHNKEFYPERFVEEAK